MRATLVAASVAAMVVVTVGSQPGQARSRCAVGKAGTPNATIWSERAKEMKRLRTWQAFRSSVRWRLTKRGIELCGSRLVIKKREHYRMKLVPEAWERYGPLIRAASQRYAVPAEIFIAIIINESALKPGAFQTYRGYASDERTPHRISVGLGATLISTARYMLKDDTIDREWLSQPENSIRMIGVYLDRHYWQVGFDPVLVAAAYNAGGLYLDDSKGNRWRLRNYPLGHSIYIDHIVAVFNAAVLYLKNQPDRPPESFASMLYGPPKVKVKVTPPEAWDDRSGPLVMYRPAGARLGVASSSIVDVVAPGELTARQQRKAKEPRGDVAGKPSVRPPRP